MSACYAAAKAPSTWVPSILFYLGAPPGFHSCYQDGYCEEVCFYRSGDGETNLNSTQLFSCKVNQSSLYTGYSINLRVRKRSFVTSDYIGLTLTGMEAEKVKYGETFIWASLW